MTAVMVVYWDIGICSTSQLMPPPLNKLIRVEYHRYYRLSH